MLVATASKDNILQEALERQQPVGAAAHWWYDERQGPRRTVLHSRQTPPVAQQQPLRCKEVSSCCSAPGSTNGLCAFQHKSCTASQLSQLSSLWHNSGRLLPAGAC